jgi:PAS domain-containing protein
LSPAANGRFKTLCGVLDLLAKVREADDDRVWARVTDKLAAALGCEAAAYFAWLPKTQELEARSALGTASGEVATRRAALGEGLVGWTAKYREAAVVDDAYEDRRFSPAWDAATGFKTRNAMTVPLFDDLELSGAIELLNKKAGPFDDDDLALTQAAAYAAAVTLRALRLASAVNKVTAHNASILENLGGGFLAVDAHGRLMLCNPAAKKILELPEILPENAPADEVLAAIPEMSEILMDTLVKKETVKRQDLWWKLRGETRVLGYSTLLIQDPRGQVVGAGMTFQDITQFQKKT